MWNKLKTVWNQRKVVVIAVAIALLYSAGGGGWTFLRRYCMPLLIVSSIPLGTWHQNLIAFIMLSLPLHYGYSRIVNANDWLALSSLGGLFGLSWYLLARGATPWLICVFTVLWPATVYLSHYRGLDWMWLELLIGFGYTIGYLVVVRDRKRGK